MTHLPENDWLKAKSTRRVMDALESERANCARFVGGCVRNALLGQPVSDIDIATQLTPDDVMRVMKAAGCAVHPTGIEHGTITVVAMNRPFEVTTLRRDVETDGRRATVAFTEDWAEDAQRRDFTINALYADANGAIYDPTGGGLQDIADRRIVFVGDADMRIREDYLRILRFFRFFAWYGAGAPDAQGLAACARLVDGLERISAERIWMEFKKLLAAPQPMPAMDAMSEAGVTRKIMPGEVRMGRLDKLVAIDEREGRSPDPLLRIMALAPDDPAGLADFARRLKVSNDERSRLLSAAAKVEPIPADLDEAGLFRLAYRSGTQELADRFNLLRAQSPDQEQGLKTHLERLENWKRPEFPVGGADVIAAGVAEGPRIGPILRAVEEEWVVSDFKMSREQLLARVQAHAKA